MVKQMLSIGQSKKSIMLRGCKSTCDFMCLDEATGYPMIQIKLLGDVKKRAGHGRQRIAIGCNQAHGVRGSWFHKHESRQSLHLTEKRKKRMRNSG